MIERIVRQVLAEVGVQGVSTVAVVLLVSMALYAHKVSKVGGMAVGVGGTVTHDLKVLAVALAGLLLLGVASLDMGRASELVRQAQSFDYGMLVDHLQQLVS